MSRKNLRFVFMKNLLFFDYQLPIFACLVLFFAMVTYWISLYFPKNRSVFKLGKGLIIISNLLFAATLAIRWITEGYFPLSNLYESLLAEHKKQLDIDVSIPVDLGDESKEVLKQSILK